MVDNKINADLSYFFGILLLIISLILILIYGFHGEGWHTAARYISLTCFLLGLYLALTGRRKKRLNSLPLARRMKIIK